VLHRLDEIQIELVVARRDARQQDKGLRGGLAHGERPLVLDRLGNRLVRLGRVLEPARARLVASGHTGDDLGPGPVVPVPPEFLTSLRLGDLIRAHDARGAKRTLRVIRRDATDACVATEQSVFFTTGSRLRRAGNGPRAVVGELPCEPGAIELHDDDELVLTTDLTPVPGGRSTSARIGCTLPEAVTALRPGHRVFLDDGKIAGVVEEVSGTEALVRITRAGARGAQLRSEKGINLPDTEIDVPALAPEDRADLQMAAEIADIVGLSFVRSPGDVEELQACLRDLKAAHLGVVVKIETVQGFRRLPAIVRAAMRSADAGVMIARGDMAVEVGYERLAEVQEEMLWLCEAAHLPVIWATEVLDRLARTGRPSRSEITDAAMSERAECVMLNKGPHIVEAIVTLDDILARMAEHQHKKRPLLRRLQSWAQVGTPPLA